MSHQPIPLDLRRVLAAHPRAKAIWGDLTPIARRDWMRWVDSAKQLETRQRRVESIPSRLTSGKRRPCCYALVPMNVYKALGKNPKAKKVWKSLTPDERRNFIDWIDAAREPEAHAVRIVRVCDILAAGRRRP